MDFNLENNFIVNSIISILLVLIVSLFIGIKYKDVLVVILISSVVIFVFHIMYWYQIHSNISLAFFKKI